MKFKIILILIVICLIGIIVLGYNLREEEQKAVIPVAPVLDPKEDDVLNLSGFGVFFEKYSGNLTTSEVSKKLDEITTTILPQIFETVKNYNENELTTYYNENAGMIKESFGIQSKEDFSKFIEKLKLTNLDLNTWYRLDLLKDTFVDISEKNMYSYVEYEVSFKNEQKIKFSLYISRNSNHEPLYIIDVIP